MPKKQGTEGIRNQSRFSSQIERPCARFFWPAVALLRLNPYTSADGPSRYGCTVEAVLEWLQVLP